MRIHRAIPRPGRARPATAHRDLTHPASNTPANSQSATQIAARGKGMGIKCENVSQSRHLAIEATIQL